MSSLVRRIQLGAKRGASPLDYDSRGARLGFHNPKAKDLLARREREIRNAESQ